MSSVSFIFLPLQLACAGLLGAFFAMERNLAGCAHDFRVLSLAGVISASVGFAINAMTGAPSFDFMAVMGMIAFASAYLLRDLLLDLSLRQNDSDAVHMDFMTLACTIWAGAACGLGDLRGCVFVVLLLTLASIGWPRRETVMRQSPILAEAAVAKPAVDAAQAGYLLALAPSPQSVFARDSHSKGEPQTELQWPQSGAGDSGNVSGAAHVAVTAAVAEEQDDIRGSATELSAMAKAIRAANAGHQTVVETFEAATAMLEAREPGNNFAPERRDRLVRHAHLTPYAWRGQGLPVQRNRPATPLQRGNHKVQ